MSAPNLGQITASTRVALPGLTPSLKLKLPKTKTPSPSLSPRHARSALLSSMKGA